MKIAKIIASALKTIGLVVLAVAVVMSLYVVTNDGSAWGTLSGTLSAYQQSTSLVQRVAFDKQFFSAMIDAASTKQYGSDVRTTRTLTFYEKWNGQLSARQQQMVQENLDALNADFNANFDVEAYLAIYEQQESGEETRLLKEAIDYLNEATTPAAPKGKKVKVKAADCEADVEAFYATFSQEHGEAAGTYLEFVETIATMVRTEVEAGNTPTSVKKFLQGMDTQAYFDALAVQLTQERAQTEDIRTDFAALVEQKKNGEAVDLLAFVDSKYEALKSRYPLEQIGEKDTFATVLLQQVQDQNFDGSMKSLLQAVQTANAASTAANYETGLKTLAEQTNKKSDDSSAIGLVVVLWWLAARWMLWWLVGALLLVISAVVDKVANKVTLARLENAGIEEDPDVLLRVNHLKQYFRSGDYINKAVDDVSFYIKKGEVFGLVGESGCGKTTTGRTIINLYDPTEGDVYFQGLRISSTQKGLPVLIRNLRNEFDEKQRRMKATLKENCEKNPEKANELKKEFNDQIAQMRRERNDKIRQARTNAMESSVEKSKCVEKYREKRKDELTKAYEADAKKLTGQALEDRKARYEQDMKVAAKDNIMTKMQMIFQDPIASINPRMTVREIIAEGLKIRGIKDEKYIDEKVYEVLDLVGLVREHADRYPHEFSGGQRQRIGIARAIVLEPDLIIADEPISALDVSIQAQVINLLNDLRNKMGLTIMFIAHNLSVVKYFSDRIGVMYFGKLVELADADELFEHPLHPYTKSLLSAIPYPDPHHEKYRKRIEYNPHKAHDYSVDKPSLREIKPGHFIYCNDAEFKQYQKELGL